MKTEFTIGQMAAMHATTVKTLRYYDAQGLLPPARIDATTGYRYYTVAQFERLNTIQYLRQLGLSIKTIRAHLSAPNVPQFLATLSEQRQLVQAQIANLQKIDRQLALRSAAITEAFHGSREPFIQHLAARHIQRLDTKIHHSQDMELPLRELANSQAAEVFIGGVGLLLSQEALAARDFGDYAGLFVVCDTPTATTTTLPGGDFACLRGNFDHEHAGPFYQRLLRWLDDQQRQVTGPAVELTIIDQDLSDDPADYCTEIQLPLTLP